MTSHHGDILKIDRTKFKYTVYYYPGSGGHIYGWLLALAHEPALAELALKCFPANLKDNTTTVRDSTGVALSGWGKHENVQNLNPYAKLIFLGVRTEKSYVTDTHGTIGSIDGIDALNKLTKLSRKHTKNIFLTMDPLARMRACYEKGARPWRTYDNPTIKSVQEEIIVHSICQEQIIKKSSIDHFLDYKDLYTNKYLNKIENITEVILTDRAIESMDRLISRYKEITPKKLLKKLINEN
jgi:hypothetical protein